MSSPLAALLTVTATAGAADVHRPPIENDTPESDWIRFDSGEWLMDEAKGLRKNVVSFDSDKVGVKDWDFDDVTDLVISQNAIYVFTDKTEAIGIGEIHGDTVTVVTKSGETITRSREELLSIVVGEDRELNRWALRLGLGLDISQGNSEQVAINATARLVRKGNATRLKLEYLGNFGAALTRTSTTAEPDTQVNVNNHQGNYAFDWYFTPRFFWTVVGGFVRHDELAGIAFKAQPGSLINWQVVDNDKVTFDVGAGAGYQRTSFIDDSTAINTGGVVGSVRLFWEPNGDIDLLASTGLFADLAVNNEFNQTTVKNRFELVVDITDIFDVNFTFIHGFVAEPRGTNPVTLDTPAQNDFQYIAGLGAEFD